MLESRGIAYHPEHQIDHVVPDRKQAVFTGRGIPPQGFDDEAELAAYVAATPGAVGYVARGTPHPGAREMILD